MNPKSIARMVVIVMAACLLMATSSSAAEILTAEDFSQMIVTEQHLVKTADNGIILFDASSSMKRAYMKTGRSMYEVAVEELKGAAARFPELGHNIGLYLYSRWKPVYPVQRFQGYDIRIQSHGKGALHAVAHIFQRISLFMFFDKNA